MVFTHCAIWPDALGMNHNSDPFDQAIVGADFAHDCYFIQHLPRASLVALDTKNTILVNKAGEEVSDGCN